MIFITLGTVLPYDGLIEKMDELKGLGKIDDEIYAQIGNGKYIPKNMQYLRFVGDMDKAYKKADIIISTCGAGALLENVTQGRKVIAIENPAVTGGHAWELVSKLEELDCLIWCRDLRNILYCIREAKTKKFEKLEPDPFYVSAIIEILEGRQ